MKILKVSLYIIIVFLALLSVIEVYALIDGLTGSRFTGAQYMKVKQTTRELVLGFSIWFVVSVALMFLCFSFIKRINKKLNKRQTVDLFESLPS